MALSDTQLILLSAASRRDDHLIDLGDGFNPGRRNAVSALFKKGLVEQTPVERGAPVWARHDDGPDMGLAITQAGLEVLGLGEATMGEALAPPASVDVSESTETAQPRQSSKTPTSQVERSSAFSGATRPRKNDVVVELLKRSGGASIDDLTSATGWLPHTTRAFLTGLRKKGMAIQREKGADGHSRYWLPDDQSTMFLASATASDRPAASTEGER